MSYRNDLIRGLMAQKGIRIEDLSEKTQLSVNTISKVRQGKDIRVSTLSKIADALGVEARDLFTFDEPKAA